MDRLALKYGSVVGALIAGMDTDATDHDRAGWRHSSSRRERRHRQVRRQIANASRRKNRVTA